ncbi:MAG: MopE-related protein [Myxococcota bacterium]
MSRSVLLALLVPLMGCPPQTTTTEIEYPKMVLSLASLEFGEAEWGESVSRTVTLSNEGGMDMGVGAVTIGDSETQYVATWSEGAIECPASTDTGAQATAKDLDTGGTGGGDDSGSTGGGDDTGGGGGTPEGVLFILGPGCKIPLTVTYTPTGVGHIYGALVVESVQAEVEKEGELPEYARDPVSFKQVVYLHGEAEHAEGTLIVTPRSYDFGYVHPDGAQDIEPARIEITNVGDGPIELVSAELASTCSSAYTISHSFEPGPLEGGTSTLVEVVYTPTDTDPAYCELVVTSDDPANPELDVQLAGNSGTDPNNVPPTAYIRDPAPGYKYNAIRPLELEINAFDVNQPATSLYCRVKSVVQGANIADCTPTDESGHVFVSIEPDLFEVGTDTLLVTVTDGSQASAYASISIVVNSDYPDDDDDGDGYGVASEPADCDDGDALTYPNAAEVFDAADNDCDSTVDETTAGYDDDGDGYAESDGDCNDGEDNVYPGAPERGDSMDNDCDSIVDEGTSLADDDGDGFAEVNNDCDDGDATVNPSATELCDNVDNDCDGLRDSADGCIADDSEPVVVGDVIRASQVACLPNDRIQLEVLAYDADGQSSTYQWQDDMGGAFDNTAAAAVNYTCAEPPDGGKNATIYAVVLDPDVHQDWAFERIAVYDAETPLYDPYKRVDTAEGGCSTAGGAAGGAWLAAALGALLARRRR